MAAIQSLQQNTSKVEESLCLLLEFEMETSRLTVKSWKCPLNLIYPPCFQELYDMASEPKEERSFILDSFEEFEALARRALHEGDSNRFHNLSFKWSLLTDLHSGIMIGQDSAACSTLCEERDNCCDDYARCTCGTHTGNTFQ